MTENKRFKLGDFDSVCEMLELLNTQRLVVSDMEKENEELKKENNQLQRYVYHCPQFCKRILAYLGKCGNEDVEAVNNAMDIDEYFDEEIDNLRL